MSEVVRPDAGPDVGTDARCGERCAAHAAHPASVVAAGWPYAATLAVWLVAVSRWLMTGTTIPWDAKNQFYAFFRFLADAFSTGTSPFWNPYHYGGHPAIADPQSLIFSPPFLLWAWLDPAPTLRAFDLMVLAHLLVGGLAVVALGRRRAWSGAASVLAATVFMLGAAASARLNHVGIIACYGLFPPALLAMELALERRSVLYALTFTILAATIVLGRNQVALMLTLVLLALAVRIVLIAPAPRVFLRTRAALFGLIAALGTALVAIPMLLTLQLAALSNRPTTSLASALEASLHPANLASLAIANVFGAHTTEPGYWGPGTATMPEVAATDDSFNYLFVGSVPIVLLLVLGLAAGALLRPGRRTLAAILTVSLLFALGRYTPLYSLVFEHVPGFSFFRRPIDAVFIVVLALALASGELLTVYVREGWSRVRLAPVAALTVAVLTVLAAAVWISTPTGNAWRAVGALAPALTMAVFVAAVMALARTPFARQRTALFVTILAIAELVYWNAASQLNAEGIDYYSVLQQPMGEDAAVLRVLETELARRHAEGARPRVEIVGLEGPWQNLAVVRRIEATNGYNPLRIGIYDRFLAPGEVAYDLRGRRFLPTFAAYDSALARAMGLEYLVFDRPIEDVRPLEYPELVDRLMAGPKAWMYRLTGTLPRVRFGADVMVADGEATKADGALSTPPSIERVVVDLKTPPVLKSARPSATSEPTPPSAGSARIASWRPDRVEIAVDARIDGVLVLADTHYPGWIAEVDGRQTPILRADVLFRAVEVPAGRHAVVFRYAPLSWANLTLAARQVFARR